VEVDPIKVFNTQPKFGSVSLFVSGTLLDARYVRWDNTVLEADPATAIVNRRVEYAPKQIWRSGANYKVEGFTASLQWSFVGQVFTDALNTVLPSSNAQTGLIEQYNLFDLSLKYEFTKQIFLQSSCNNLLDTRYATRRAGGYPGPGLLPGTGRNITITLGLNV
jgi:Fe(3+) dicitrate transport protein